MKIRNVNFGEKPLFLAPMAGVSDVGFREEAVKFGADVTYTEMLSARAMAHNPKKTDLMTITSPLERLTVAQIFGHESEYLVKALENEMLDKFPAIDINMGCPAPKIVKNGEGAALMDNILLAEKIIKECVKSSSRPVSVKFRLGKDSDKRLEFGRMCEEAGASFVTLHARTVSQGYSGKANYSSIATLASALKIPVVGNGDVVDQKSYQDMLETGVSGVMIGRGAQGRPWVFQEIFGKTFDGDKIAVVKEHLETLRKYYDEKWLTLYMRKHFLWYSMGSEGGAQERVKLATSQNLDESLQILRELLK